MIASRDLYPRSLGVQPGYRQYQHLFACLNFRTRMGTDYDAEAWLHDELGQNWRH
jgi:hypothetical protein